MQLGELIANFDDEALAAEAISALNDILLTARIRDAAAEQEVTIGEFASESVQHFMAHAGDAALTTTIGRMNDSEQPGLVLLHDALIWTLSQPDTPQRQATGALR